MNPFAVISQLPKKYENSGFQLSLFLPFAVYHLLPGFKWVKLFFQEIVCACVQVSVPLQMHRHVICTVRFKIKCLPWPGIVLIHQGHGFDSPSGHIQETTNECISKGNSKQMFSLSLSPLLSLSLKSVTILRRGSKQKCSCWAASLSPDLTQIF